MSISRADIILGTAEKEGGAHVNAKSSAAFDLLSAIGAPQMYELDVSLSNGRVVRLPAPEAAPET